MPLTGAIAPPSVVTSTGPTMNTSSSTIASNAYARSAAGVPRPSRKVQRARSIEETGGSSAPVTAAAGNSVQTGAGRRISSDSTTSPTACGTHARRVVRWPIRSARFPSAGDPRAPAQVRVALTAPAKAYECWMSETSTTTPSPSIDIGSRPKNPAVTKARAPGTRSSAA